jgi:hypothetical protein
MRHFATLEYSEHLVREAVFAYWSRTIGTGFFIALALLLGCLAFLIWDGDRSWFVGALGTTFLFAIGFALAVYLVHLRNAMAKFRAMGVPVATLSLDETCFSISSGLGNSSLHWSAVSEIWRFPSFWLLLFSKAQFVTIPLAKVSFEAQALILSRVSSAGGKVVG